MTHAYSIEIHNYLKEKTAIALKNKKQAGIEDDPETRAFYSGQLKEMQELKDHIVEKIDLISRREPLES